MAIETKKSHPIRRKGIDAQAMEKHFQIANDLIEGVEALRKCREKYLPKFIGEDAAIYNFRVTNSKFTNIYGDIIEGLASKPFGKMVEVDLPSGLKGDTNEKFFIDDVDGQGTSAHDFFATTFYHGINSAIDWIFVDNTTAPETGEELSVAQEEALGIRPYFVRIPASSVLDVQSEIVNGREQFTTFRYLEYANVVNPRTEVEEREERVRRIRRVPGEDALEESAVIVWDLWAERFNAQTQTTEWVVINEGRYRAIYEIPIVPFICGRRKGTTWQVQPPMSQAANLQVKHYQQETDLDFLRTWTAYPMLTVEGMDKPTIEDGRSADISVGPFKVLYGGVNENGTNGKWGIISPPADILNFHKSDIEATAKEIRELGRQPLTAQSPNLTVISSASASQKGSVAVQAWALSLKKTAEHAFRLMAAWRGVKDAKIDVKINTDFDILLDDGSGSETIEKMRERGDLSQETSWNEFVRRGVLSPDFDADEERRRLTAEVPGDDADEELDALDVDSIEDDPPQ